MFNSVLKSAKQDLGISSDKLRLAVANHIEANPNDYSGFLEENLATYLPKLKAGETWGGEVEISVISKLYKMKISILQWTNGQKSCSVQDFCNFEGEAENSCHILFYKYLMSSCHYDGTK